VLINLPSTNPTGTGFVASDLNLYYDPLNTGWYKRPDWFAVVGVISRTRLALELCVMARRVRPVVAIELLSPGIQDEDGREESLKVSNLENGRSTSRILGVPYTSHSIATTTMSCKPLG